MAHAGIAQDTFASATLVNSLWPVEERAQRLGRDLVLALLGAAILTISAKIQMPMFPVPMTMQTYVVMVIAMAYGWQLGLATVGLYLAQGLVGLPVFATGGGFAYFAGPTGGYLIGFLVATLAMGWLAERGWDRRLLLVIPAVTLGTVIFFLCGVAWLSVLIGFDRALEAGLLPFVPGAAAKLVLAAATVPAAWHFVKRFRET
ncbi:biotin transporter BioY [Algihabitans albus]|uniref:biotin transporter BioY n=1 Tax=Algihabitans albus TaxID=2164067 RepID=UPI000E5CF7C9|nr:biotin transporter BioY [Algihabitans albus]